MTLLYKNKGFIDAAVYSEYEKVIKCDFKPGSVGRSIDLYQRGGIPQQAICSTFATNKNRAIFQWHTFVSYLESIKYILEA
jgi:hypothetical protein